MSLADDFQADLQEVFFSDFQDVAVINELDVIGYLDIHAHRWADIDSRQHIFSVPAQELALERNQALTINGRSYTYVTTRSAGQLDQIIVTPR